MRAVKEVLKDDSAAFEAWVILTVKDSVMRQIEHQLQKSSAVGMLDDYIGILAKAIGGELRSEAGMWFLWSIVGDLPIQLQVP